MHMSPHHDQNDDQGQGGWLARSQLPVAIAAGATLAVGFGMHWLAKEESAVSLVGLVLIWISLGLGSIHGLHAAWESLREFKPDIDVLMVVGAYLAAGIGHPEEGALLLFLFTLAGALEHRALERTREAVARLTKLMPSSALRREGEEWVSVPPEELAADDVILVRPGSTIPADAVVLEGRSSVDQSTITGESLPREVQPGDDVYTGTMNQNGAIEARVTRPAGESSLARILALVTEAQAKRRPVQRVIDRFSMPYTLIVFSLAILALLLFYFAADYTFNNALYRAITLLVVASPCALVLSTPTATLCGLSRAARDGVLIKGGDALERLSRVRTVAFDKTGTLTRGQIDAIHIHPVAAFDEATLLSLAYGLERTSTHPIAAALVRLAQSHELEPFEVESIQNVPGRGVEGVYDGSPVRIGSYAFCEPLIMECFRKHTHDMAQRILDGGAIAVVIAHESGSAVVALADEPRQGARDLDEQLRAVGVHQTAMLTGDDRRVAARLAERLGIENVHAELLPEDKVAHIEQLRRDQPPGHSLAVVGDGVNDAPALAVADVGLAMGHIGADAALETADVILLHDDIDRVPWSIHLARKVKRTIIVNLTFATLVIAVLVVLAMGDLTLSLGVLGHEGSTLVVIANSLRLLMHRSPG